MTRLGDRALRNLRDLVAEPEPGEVLGARFELGQCIGRGGMGVVYAAVDRETGRDVAVKIVAVTAQHDEPRFLREVATLARASHPSVVSYIAHGVHEGTPYLVMDRLRGVTLAERLVTLSIQQAITIARRMAEGLSVVHAAGITHRDIKPSNVFLVGGAADEPRLLDFGLARPADAVTLTQQGARVGTPGYMAPEQIRGERASPAADIFALGCILYECVARRAAFASDGTATVHARILLEEPPALERAGAGAPRALADLVARMIAKKPSDRPSATEVARELEAIAVELPETKPIAPILPNVWEGDVIAGKYRIERRIGEGGMGIVLAAKHLDLGTRVALKWMRGSARADQARFLREAQAASRLESEHVARVLDVGRTADGAPYMVMEYLNGTDLAARLRERGPLPLVTAVDYVLQTCEAIAEAHALGIVHRDLKPSNLFLVERRDGTEMVKVLDFGISKLTRGLEETASAVTVTDATAVVGSIPYMSPEQLQASTDVDARSDVWSIGIVLYEILSGTRPFDGESPLAIGARIAAAPPPRLRDARPEVPAALEAAVLRCLEKKRDDRYPDLAELARALALHGSEAARASAPRIARLLGAPSSARRAETRKPSWRFAALGLAAFVSATVVVRSVFTDAPRVPPDGVQAGASTPAFAKPLPVTTPAATEPAAPAQSSSRMTNTPLPTAPRASSSAPARKAVGRPAPTVSASGPQRPLASAAPSATSPGIVDVRDPALQGR